MRWVLGLLGVVLVGGALVGCAALLPVVKLDPALAPTAPPPILGAFGDDPEVTTQADWENRRAPILRRAFAERVYGPYPSDAPPPRLIARSAIVYAPLADAAIVEQWSVAVGDEDHPSHFNMMVVLPKNTGRRAPMIVMENFCGNHRAFPDAPDQVAGPLTPAFPACDVDWAQPLVTVVFGRQINGPPFADVLARGYGLALFYAGDVVGDEPVSARTGLLQLYGDQAANAGAVAVWAWLYSEAYDVLAADARIDPQRVAIWGHSRNGKAVLLAGAMDSRFAAIIAHQSGRGGASLSHSANGEPIAKMMEEYSYWFPPAFANAASSEPSFDQHELIALIAPRPVLLGNGARDAWSDPRAAWSAATAADPVYRLYGVAGLQQADMRTPNPDARIWFYTRPGLHGVTSRDWREFLDFLDAQMGPDAVPPQLRNAAAAH
jgi:(4-O-methyl)-D-glucuronate---lignin esterase